MITCKTCPQAYTEQWPEKNGGTRIVIRCGAKGPREGYVIAANGVPAWCPREEAVHDQT